MKSLLLFLIGAVLLSCNVTPDVESKDVESQIVQKIHSSKNSSLLLRSLINIKWDKLYIIGPYTYDGMLNNDLRPYKDKIKSTGIDTREDITVLYFLKDSKLVAEASVERNIDFSPVGKLDSKNHLIYFTPDQELQWINVNGRYTIKSIK